MQSNLLEEVESRDGKGIDRLAMPHAHKERSRRVRATSLIGLLYTLLVLPFDGEWAFLQRFRRHQFGFQNFQPSATSLQAQQRCCQSLAVLMFIYDF